jgi:hypothetical protein
MPNWQVEHHITISDPKLTGGYVSASTASVYAEVDLEMKAEALANCEVAEEEERKPWREDGRCRGD